MIFSATGHRLPKLGGYSDKVFVRLVGLATDYLISTMPDEAISGMALGWDQAWAQAAIDMHIPLTCAIPCNGQESQWPHKSQVQYRAILSKAAKIVNTSPGPYAAWKMQKRNEWMVDNCDKVIALWDRSGGGTANCITYAKSIGKPIINLWDKWRSA